MICDEQRFEILALELPALWSEAQRWIPLHNDTGTASGAEDDYTSLWVSIIINMASLNYTVGI